MLTSLCASLFVLAAIVLRKRNKLPGTVMIPLWLFSIFITGLPVHLVITNLHLLEKPRTPDPYISFLLLHNLVLPIALLLILNLYLSARRSFRPVVLILGSVFLFAGEMAVERIGVFGYAGWNPGYSPFVWFGLVGTVLAFYRFMVSEFIKKG